MRAGLLRPAAGVHRPPPRPLAAGDGDRRRLDAGGCAPRLGAYLQSRPPARARPLSEGRLRALRPARGEDARPAPGRPALAAGEGGITPRVADLVPPPPAALGRVGVRGWTSDE